MAVDLQKYISDADKALSALDEKTLARLRAILQKSYSNLEREIQKKWGKVLDDSSGQSRSFAEARARVLAQQLGETLNVLDSPMLSTLMSDHVEKLVAYETSAASAIVVAFSPADAKNFRIPIEKITNIVRNIGARLKRHSDDFRTAAENVLVNGAVNGHGFKKMARALKEAVGTTFRRAETVVRTESMNASDEVRRERYKASKIEYVQRIATQDKKVCGFCAARAGNVYKIDEAPQSLHPNDRCYNAPWKKEWQELGLISTDWVKKHADDARERSEDSLHYGVAPFEKYAGMKEPPQPIWTPYKGYT